MIWTTSDKALSVILLCITLYSWDCWQNLLQNCAVFCLLKASVTLVYKQETVMASTSPYQIASLLDKVWLFFQLDAKQQTRILFIYLFVFSHSWSSFGIHFMRKRPLINLTVFWSIDDFFISFLEHASQTFSLAEAYIPSQAEL